MLQIPISHARTIIYASTVSMSYVNSQNYKELSFLL